MNGKMVPPGELGGNLYICVMKGTCNDIVEEDVMVHLLIVVKLLLSMEVTKVDVATLEREAS